MVFMINSTLAPPILLAHTLVAKMSMTILFRAKLTLKATALPTLSAPRSSRPRSINAGMQRS